MGKTQQERLTQRALDAGDSAAFSSFFLGLSFLRFDGESSPSHLPLTRAVGHSYHNNRTPSSKHRTSSSALRRTSQGTRSELKNEGQPLAEYLATYRGDDEFFDLSFEIEKSSRYLGECGIAVARVLDAQSSTATALELWLFDPQGAQTISKILASHFCFGRANLRNELEQKGQVLLIQAGETIALETKQMKAQARVLHVEYEPSSPNPQSLFKKVVIEIKVWENAE